MVLKYLKGGAERKWMVLKKLEAHPEKVSQNFTIQRWLIKIFHEPPCKFFLQSSGYFIHMYKNQQLTILLNTY